jgi:AcrR family transcriptional regulator
VARPRVRPQDLATADRILGAAEQAFARAGYGGARLEDIAAGAGITRPSLLYHFDSKDLLYGAVVRRAFQRLGAGLLRALGGEGTLEARLAAAFGVLQDYLAQDRAFAPLVLREVLDGTGPGRDLIVEQVVPLLDRVEAFLAEGPSCVNRADVVNQAAAALCRAAAGNLAPALWGPAPPAPFPRLSPGIPGPA